MFHPPKCFNHPFFHLVVSCNTNCTISFKTSLLQTTAAMPKQNVSVCLLTFQVFYKNIARGTTDPEIDSVTWIKFINNMAPLALVAYLATRWRHSHWLQIWPPDGATCIGSKFGHQMAPLALVANLDTRWNHLHSLQIFPPS